MAQTIGIDIGGANTKVASASGTARSFYFPLWRKKDLAGLLRRVKDDFKPERVGIVITGELADAFSSKKEGICSIVAAVNSVFSKPYYLNVRGELTQGIEEDALLYAASNWAASAAFLAKSVKNCIFTDVGSTTCDVIPIQNGKAIAQTRDFKRLERHELIYMGVLRTNIATILRFVNLSGKKYRLSTEQFSITADVHRVLGSIDETDYTCDTPDSKIEIITKIIEELSDQTDSNVIAFFEQVILILKNRNDKDKDEICLLYTSDAADEEDSVDLGGRR